MNDPIRSDEITLPHVWVVEQGSYSDYRVVAAFNNEAAAEQHAAAINTADCWEPASVAKWEVLSEAPRRIVVHNYEMSRDGGIRQWTYDAWANDAEPEFKVHLVPGGKVLSRARTADEAKKAAHDALAEAAARREGLT